jgi:molybdopterin converting factor small subunit
LAVEATTVSGVLKQLEAHHPALYRSVCDETGAVRIHVNLFVNANFIRRPQDLETLLSEGDQVSIMPAVSGG